MSTVLSACGRILSRRKAIVAAAGAALMLMTGGAHAAARAGDDASTKVEIVIDKAKQQMTVYVGGEKRYVWKVSTGRAGYATPSGTFRPSSMHKMAISVKYGNTPMPHTIFFTGVGHAIHATKAVGQLGRPASHGCIRLSPENAATLFALVQQMGLHNTRIRIV
jgi:lipoprotein-anchoring transpeptidase ErfK/SrfK